MKENISKGRNYFLIILAAIGWIAIILQLYLLLKNRKLDVLPTIIQFFSYFTILTNLLVALYSSCILISPRSDLGKWFSRPATATALTVYITIVGVVYNIILRFLWAPQGLQRFVDEALHSLIPILCIIHWLVWVPKQSLEWKNAFPWLVYPLAYFTYILIRGVFSSLYPYPFIDVTVLGFSKVLINSLGLSFVFLVVGLLYVGIGKLITAKAKQIQ